MKQFVFFCLLFIQNSIWSQSDTTRFVIRTYGFSSWSAYEQLEDSIATNWDITYLPVAGCVVTDEFVDSIERMNQATDSRLKAHYGPDWKERFKKEVNTAYSNLQHHKKNTFQEVANCITEAAAFNVLENLNQTELKFCSIPQKAGNQSNNDIRLVGLQNIDPTILYRGYENTISLEFGSLADTVRVSIKAKGELQLLDSCPVANKIRIKYRVLGSSRYDTLLVETTNGIIQQYVFKYVHLNTPEVYFNEVLLDSTLFISTLNTTSVLSMHYDRDCLIPAHFAIRSWEIYYSDSGNKSHRGEGNIIPLSVIRKLKKLKPGTPCSILLIVGGPDSVLRKKTVYFTLI